MISNSTNKNKTNNFTSNDWTQKRSRYISGEIHVLAWDGHKNVAVLI